MSILIKGMEMPENCECCPMVYTADVQCYHWCAALEQEVEQGLSRPKECPIICALPERHGRLIDADELFYDLFVVEDGRVVPNMDCDGRHHLSMHVKDIKRRILEAPTIVPAEAQRKVYASDAVTPTDTPTDTPTVPAERSDT